MTRPDSDSPQSYDFTAQVIRIEADKLARRHGVDAKRVRDILKRTARDYYGRPIQAPSPGRDNLSEGLQFLPSLDEALAYLPSDAALTVFEQVDPALLATRAHLVDYLAEPTSPSYTRIELAELLERFSSHLSQNYESLIQTGYPRTRFDESPWLEWHLGLLSPTKFPASALPLSDPTRSAESDRADNPVYSRFWTRAPVPPVWNADGPFLARSFFSQFPDDRCPYEEAALMHGMSPSVAGYLEDGRGNFFKLKQDVVLVCAGCLRSANADALWPSVLSILINTVLWCDAQRYFEIEEIYWQAGVGECVVQAYQMRAPNEVPGTLSTLLTVIGHVEKELRHRTFDQTMSAIRTALLDSGISNLESYFEVVDQRGQTAIDAALDGFSQLEQQEQSFWKDYRGRVNAALETELREEVVIRVPVKRKLVATFEPYLRTFAEWQGAQLEAMGNLSPLQLSSLPEPTNLRCYRFRLEGQVWTIEYEGKVVQLKDVKGLRYLAILLANPNREFHVLDLVRRVEGTRIGQNQSQTGLDREAVAQLNQTGWGFADAGEMIDDDAIVGLRQRLQELPGEIDEKLEFGDADSADRLRTEQDAIINHLAKTLGLGGRSRKASSTADHARTAVTKRISHARKAIAEHHPALGQHLRSVKTGTYCQYSPDSAIDWEI